MLVKARTKLERLVLLPVKHLNGLDPKRGCQCTQEKDNGKPDGDLKQCLFDTSTTVEYTPTIAAEQSA
jgi:hypothetical protein